MEDFQGTELNFVTDLLERQVRPQRQDHAADCACCVVPGARLLICLKQRLQRLRRQPHNLMIPMPTLLHHFVHEDSTVWWTTLLTTWGARCMCCKGGEISKPCRLSCNDGVSFAL